MFVNGVNINNNCYDYNVCKKRPVKNSHNRQYISLWMIGDKGKMLYPLHKSFGLFYCMFVSFVSGKNKSVYCTNGQAFLGWHSQSLIHMNLYTSTSLLSLHWNSISIVLVFPGPQHLCFLQLLQYLSLYWSVLLQRWYWRYCSPVSFQVLLHSLPLFKEITHKTIASSYAKATSTKTNKWSSGIVFFSLSIKVVTKHEHCAFLLLRKKQHYG